MCIDKVISRGFIPAWSGRFFSVNVGAGIKKVWLQMFPIVDQLPLCRVQNLQLRLRDGGTEIALES
jgi:hypothetical protein